MNKACRLYNMLVPSWVNNTLIQSLLTPTLLREHEARFYRQANERPIEYAFVFKHLSKTYPSSVLDVGSGQSALPALIAYCGLNLTAIDEKKSYWRDRVINRHYYVVSDDITKPKIGEAFDMITCVSTLEHVPNHTLAVKGIFGLLKSRGYVCFTFPYNERKYVENVYKLPGAGYGQDASYICQVFSRNEVDSWIRQNGGIVVDQEYWRLFTGDLWTFGKQILPPERTSKERPHHLSCLLIQKI
jgi:SAM-dependent methyltransferase